MLIRITAHNRGPEPATLHLLPTLWFRNTWSWPGGTEKPALRAAETRGATGLEAEHALLGRKVLLCEREDLPVLVRRERDERGADLRPHGGTPFPKDGINDCVVQGRQAAVNPERIGTKGAMHWEVTIPPGGCSVLRLRLRDADAGTAPFGAEFERCFEAPPGRGRCLLPRRLAGRLHRGRGPGVPPGARRHAVEQAVLPVRRAASGMAELVGKRAAQRRLVAYGQCRHLLHAGQVGIPLVRGLGPCLPHAGARRWWTRNSPRTNSS